MSKQYKVVGIKKDRRYLKFLLPIYVIIPFLSFFFYFLLFTQSPIFLLRSYFFEYEPQINYDTFKVYIDPKISAVVKEGIVQGVGDIEFKGQKRFEFVEKDESDFVLGVTDSKTSQSFISRELIPVGHIYWIEDEFNIENFKKILLEKQEYLFANEYLSQYYDIPVEKVENLSEGLLDDEESVGFLFPSNLGREYKTLTVDGEDPLSIPKARVTISYSLEGDDRASFVYGLLQKNIEILENDILNDEKLVKINMTGVTAISRGLASKIDAAKDYGYPARDIGSFLADADLTHTSNEVSFMDGCSVYSGMRFCSKPEYIETLEKSGIDIVELTGNHNNDFGASNNAKSIEMYKDLGWDYFGGGLNSEDASKILYKEVKGSKIAFVGYNYYDTMLNTGAIAGDDRAGANSYSLGKLEADIKEGKENADVVIVTFQFQECYSYPSSDVIYPICYKPLSSPDQKGVFRKAVDFGADVVVGTQAHQPQTYEVYKDGVIFYGLGNLYFDQSRWIGTRQGLVLSLYILEGKLVRTELTPTIYGNDLIPRIASEQEGDLLLNLLKSARNF